MGSVPTPIDVGFAEFVALLMSETLESVMSAQVSQEEQRQALLEAATLDVDEFSKGFVSDADVDLLLAAMFPDGDSGTTIEAGEAPPDDDALEQLDVTLTSNDVTQGKLTARGVTTIREAARREAGARRLNALRESARQGIPRVIVGNGRIVAKLTFSTVVMSDEDDDARGPAAPGTPDPVTRATRFTPVGTAGLVDVSLLRSVTAPSSRIPLSVLDTGTLARAIPTAVRDIRLVVKPANPDDPQTSTTANVFGEVELNFQTIL